MKKHRRFRVAQTQGRSWDGNLHVYNNPISRWWLVALGGAGVAVLGYWLMYPSWPGTNSYYPGLFEIELNTPKGEVHVPWSSYAELQAKREQDPLRIKQRRLMAGVERSDYHTLVGDPNMLHYALAGARVPYLDNCAGCHRADGTGISGLGSDLVSGEWRRDADFSTIEQQVRSTVEGGHGVSAGEDSGGRAGPHQRRGKPGGRQVNEVIDAGCEECHALSSDGSGRALAEDGTVDGLSSKPLWRKQLSFLQIKTLTVYVQQLGK